MRRHILCILRLMRPYQWYKNLLVFVPLIFSLNAMNIELYSPCLIAFTSLCLASSVNYIINDIKDLERDKLHPEKRMRPLPSGEVKLWEALALALALSILSLIMGWCLGRSFSMTLLAFLALGQLYNFVFREIPLIDVIIIGFNYVLRTVAGAVAIRVRISPWLFLGIFLVALMLSLGKRRAELEVLGDSAIIHRGVYKAYTKELMDMFLIMISTSVIMTYSMYSIYSPIGDCRLIITVPLVIYIVMRYLYLVYSKSPIARSMEKLYKDHPLLSALLLWLLMVLTLLYAIPRGGVC